jgi:hypothetical protein
MKTVACYRHLKKYGIKNLEIRSLHLERRAAEMIETNARAASGMVVVRGPSLREWLSGRLVESPARVCSVDPDSVANAAQTLDEVICPESRLRDPGETPARWVRLV